MTRVVDRSDKGGGRVEGRCGGQPENIGQGVTGNPQWNGGDDWGDGRPRERGGGERKAKRDGRQKLVRDRMSGDWEEDIGKGCR